MDLDNVLLGLIRLHQDVTGYELNRIISESTGYLMSASLSHIYPSLRSLHEKGLVEFIDKPIKNRLAKKIYHITPAGEEVLNDWLKTPVGFSEMDFRPFLLKMSFSPLMTKEIILDHIDREINQREQMLLDHDRGNKIELDYIGYSDIDPSRAQFLWSNIYSVGLQTSHLQLEWLKKWRQQVDSTLLN